MDRMAKQRHEQRLRELPYPEQRRYDHPFAVGEDRFYPPAYAGHELARIHLQAPLVQGAEDPASAGLWLEVLASRPVIELSNPIASVSITLVAHRPPRLPTFDDPLPVLELVADGRLLTYRLHPSSVGMQLARQHAAKAPGSSQIGLSIPTEDFLILVLADRVEGRIGDVSFTVPPQTREALRDFASRMRPSGR
jgi:hypothetical protein